MSTYRVEWPCGDVTETDSWEPSECPICRLADVEAERDAARVGIGKMQEVVRNAGIDAVREYLPDFDELRIDGAGTDGDEYDFTGAEVAQAVHAVGEKLAEVEAERDTLRRLCLDAANYLDDLGTASGDTMAARLRAAEGEQ